MTGLFDRTDLTDRAPLTPRPPPPVLTNRKDPP